MPVASPRAVSVRSVVPHPSWPPAAARRQTLPVTRGIALTSVTTPLRLFRSHRSAVSRALAPIIAGAILATAMVAPVSAVGRTFYVATNGSDSNSGSISHPWRSFHASLTEVTRGRHGSMCAAAPTRSRAPTTRRSPAPPPTGSSSPPIQVSDPIFTGTTTPADFLYFSGNSAYITLRGLTIQGGGANDRRATGPACWASSATRTTSGSRRTASSGRRRGSSDSTWPTLRRHR